MAEKGLTSSVVRRKINVFDKAKKRYVDVEEIGNRGGLFSKILPIRHVFCWKRAASNEMKIWAPPYLLTCLHQSMAALSINKDRTETDHIKGAGMT